MSQIEDKDALMDDLAYIQNNRHMWGIANDKLNLRFFTQDTHNKN